MNLSNSHSVLPPRCSHLESAESSTTEPLNRPLKRWTGCWAGVCFKALRKTLSLLCQNASCDSARQIQGQACAPREPDIGCISEAWQAGIVVCLKTCPALCCSGRSTSHGTTASTSHTLAAVGWGLGVWVLSGTWKSESTTARKGQGKVRAGEA